MSTASMSLRSSISLYFLVAKALGSASLRPSARLASQTSQTAAIRTLGMPASECIRWRQRPPVPTQPTLSVSLAPSTFAAGTPRAASPAAPAAAPRKEGRGGRGRGGGGWGGGRVLGRAGGGAARAPGGGAPAFSPPPPPAGGGGGGGGGGGLLPSGRESHPLTPGPSPPLRGRGEKVGRV